VFGGGVCVCDVVGILLLVGYVCNVVCYCVCICEMWCVVGMYDVLCWLLIELINPCLTSKS